MTTYLIGAILVLLLIALIFIFKPPKPMADEEEKESDFIDSEGDDQEGQLGFDYSNGESKVDDSEELVLTLDEPLEDDHDEEEIQEEEEELVLSLDDAEEMEQTETAEPEDEFILELGDDEAVEVETTDEPLAAATEIVEKEEAEEDIPFIIEDEDSSETAGDMSPALGDVPDDYIPQEEGEEPEELADRLEYFLGTDNEAEVEIPVEEQEEEVVAEIEGEAGPETQESEQQVELEESVEPSDELALDQDEETLLTPDPETETVAEKLAGDSLAEEKNTSVDTPVFDDESAVHEGELAPALGEVPEDYEPQDEEGDSPEMDSKLDNFLETGEGVAAESQLQEQGEESPAEDGWKDLLGEVASEESVEIQDEEIEPVSHGEPLPALEGKEETEYVDLTSPTEDLAGGEDKNDELLAVSEDDAFDEQDGEIAPALGEVPEGYIQVDESEAPDELADRLEYFLGTDDEEIPEAPVESPVAEPIAEVTGEEEQEEASIEEQAEAPEEIAEAVLDPDAELTTDTYKILLKKQEAKLRKEMDEAINDKDAEKLNMLSFALENLCAKQVNIVASFQVHQNLTKGIESMLNELSQVLTGFPLEAAWSSLKKREYDVIRSMIRDAAGKLEDSPQMAAKILFNWGRFEEEQGELVEAGELFSKGYMMDNTNPDCLFSSGRLARIAGDLDTARDLLEKRVAIGDEQEEEGVGIARAKYELAKTLSALDTEPERAEYLLEKALEAVEKALGTDNPNLGPVLHELAVIHDIAGRFDKAEPIYKRSLEVVENALGNESPRLGLTLTKYAGLYEEMENHDKSEPLYRRALEIRQKILGENHPEVGTLMGRLANILKAKGLYDQAEPLYKKSLGIAEVYLGKDHPNLSMVYTDMAELYSEMGNEEEAAKYQEQALSAFGMPGMDDGFVEMEKDTSHDDDDNNQTVAGD